ncbi:4Fe-4S binding protein [Blastopirellula marina]|uniref:Ferredoxin n=1 Tax=Blastopirellula marina TaxID=124 RepID=A0A2S8GND1_9BACT|nr:4Fe-4S binding protein [Blastopirellula marina]PQO45935.1 ferredoxin [Blastopirellula marina]
MAMKIDPDECIACGACEPECPTTSITSTSLAYAIDAATCTECAGEYKKPRCVTLCPIDECITQICT